MMEKQGANGQRRCYFNARDVELALYQFYFNTPCDFNLQLY